MKKIKTFFHVLVNSLFPLDHYYRKILKSRLLFSLKYFLALVFSLTFVFILVFLFKNLLINNSLTQLRASLIKSLDNYPPDLVITIKNNRLFTNFDRPYIFWVEYRNVPHPVLVVDERATVEKIYQFDSTAILVNANGVIKRTVGGKLRFYPFKFKNDVIVNKQVINNWKNLVSRFFVFFQISLPFFLILAFLGLGLLIFFSQIIFLALISLIGFWLSKIFKLKTNYKKLFQLSLHSNTLPLISEFVILFLFWRLKFFPYYLLLTLIFFATAIYEAYHNHLPVKVSHPHPSHTHRHHHTRLK